MASTTSQPSVEIINPFIHSTFNAVETMALIPLPYFFGR